MQVTCFHNPDEENGYLSNWYPSRFACDGVAYSSMEQFMMHRKALLFGDERVASLLLSSEDPAEIKRLGREVSGYDDITWNGARQIVVYEGLLAKLSQNGDLLNRLLATGDDALAECAKAEKDSIVGDPLALWAFEDPKHPRYLVDGMEGGMTLVGTFEKEVGVVTYRDGVLLVATSLIATREYVEAQAR